MAGENVSAINPYGMSLYNNYTNSVMLDDLCGFNSGIPGMMSMDGSLFSGGTMTTPFMPGCGGGFNTESYFNNMQMYQDFMYDQQIRQNQKQRQVNFQVGVQDEVMAKKLDILHEKIVQNEQQQVLPALQSLLESISGGAGQGGTPDQLIARAESLYQQRFQASISDDLRKYGNGSLTQGFLQTVSLGCMDKTTAEENIAAINNQPVSRWENTKKLVGNGLGGAMVGATSLYAISSLPLLKGLFKSKPLIAAGVGAIAGLLSGIGIGLFNQNSSKKIYGEQS